MLQSGSCLSGNHKLCHTTNGWEVRHTTRDQFWISVWTIYTIFTNCIHIESWSRSSRRFRKTGWKNGLWWQQAKVSSHGTRPRKGAFLFNYICTYLLCTFVPYHCRLLCSFWILLLHVVTGWCCRIVICWFAGWRILRRHWRNWRDHILTLDCG